MKFYSFKWVAVYLILIIAVIASLFPVFWMLSTAFKPIEDLFKIPPQWIPKNPTLENFRYTFTIANGIFLKFFRNSLIVSTAVSLLSLFAALISAYSFSRFKYNGRDALMLWVLATQMIPMILLLISLYALLVRIRMLNLWGLTLTYMCFALPFAVWMLKGFFDSIPIDLEEQAMVDGCTRLSAMIRITLPLILPGIIATALFNFLSAWDEFMFAITIIHANELRTLPAGMFAIFIGEKQIRWGPMMAGSIFITIPVVIVFIFLQKYLVQGLTKGAIKG